MLKGFLCLPVLLMFMLITISSCSNNNVDDELKPYKPTDDTTSVLFDTCLVYGSMTDQDNNVYKTVTIGAQTWMTENLRTTTYNDGAAIQNTTDSSYWRTLTTGAYCNYNNTNNTDTILLFGRLYNWYTVNTGKLAPKGWHVPSNAEWTTFVTYLGGKSVAGGKLKEMGISHWKTPNYKATNKIGFTALPSGFRDTDGTFDGMNKYSFWWSNTVFYAGHASFCWATNYSNCNIGNDGVNKKIGLSIRCIKD